MTLIDGGEISDSVLEIDSAAKRFRYERTHSPFPVSQYFGTVEIYPDSLSGRKNRLPSCEKSIRVGV
jgi:hypothetical protein